MENFIREYWLDPKMCDDLLDYYKNNTEYKYKQEGKVKVCQEVAFHSESRNPIIQKYFAFLNTCIEKYVNQFDIFIQKGSKLITSEATLIQHYKPGEGFFPWHTERDSIGNCRRQLVFMTYLNDVKDGGTQFKFQNLTVQAKKGKTLLWPSDFTHSHKGQISHSSEKTIITGWLSYDSLD